MVWIKIFEKKHKMIDMKYDHDATYTNTKRQGHGKSKRQDYNRIWTNKSMIE